MLISLQRRRVSSSFYPRSKAPLCTFRTTQHSSRALLSTMRGERISVYAPIPMSRHTPHKNPSLENRHSTAVRKPSFTPSQRAIKGNFPSSRSCYMHCSLCIASHSSPFVTFAGLYAPAYPSLLRGSIIAGKPSSIPFQRPTPRPQAFSHWCAACSSFSATSPRSDPHHLSRTIPPCMLTG